MALGLYVAAAAMVISGLLAIYFGADIIVMERGWTMVIAGSVVAASGALLAGIAAAVARLQALEIELAHFGDRIRRPEAPPVAQAAAIASEPSALAEPGVSSSPGAARDLAAYRDLEITPEPVLGRASPVAAFAADPLPEEDPAAPTALARDTGAAETAAPRSEPAAETPVVADEEPPPATVVGTYNSGGNFYIMYSDGSIEAETPAGKFRFNSLDELKDFIARGGDKVKAGTSP